MENMAAWELLWSCIRAIRMGRRILSITVDHLLTAYDTSPVAHGRELCFCGIWISLIHIPCCSLIPVESPKPRDEGPGGDINISDNVQWEAIESNDDYEENEICRQFEEVCSFC